VQSEDGFHLLRGRDIDKDQSYFLYTCRQEELGKTLFPIGEYTKAEVRELARSVGLATADKPESQDICFVAGSVQDFVTKIGGGRTRGNFVSRDGRKLGEHEGIHRFTVGQRKGLALGGSPEPLYVLELNPATNEVVVGSKEELQRESFEVGEMHWVNPILRRRVAQGEFPFEVPVTAQVRSRHRGVAARMRVLSADRCEMVWTGDWAAVSPGQAAVLYDDANQELLAGGRIVK
jgi:tRNA-specific 2-thiouridylase